MRALVAASMLALLAGCAGTDFTYDNARKVRVGMTEAEVARLMGPPSPWPLAATNRCGCGARPTALPVPAGLCPLR